ncbi:SGNH hydrolase domain-containing protein [Curtobacterium sp. MCJR17_043]|uniref:SGNH hydrolase domain-containing protein n=1 Tax=Curtobacterium sp. MCJR17_043 TaxID=2175660 RepID=UPI0024E00669|nr:SGNH hydrolase domain-containing protein [Curtobacterium sp. MCJR17_043]WIB34848.1 SGNH hydrolase domain-containing protein [Curtobacterium sp. MCJR17_043]
MTSAPGVGRGTTPSTGPWRREHRTTSCSPRPGLTCGAPPEGPEPARRALEGYRASWQPLVARGTTVVAIPDTPAAGSGAQRCVDEHPDSRWTCRISAGRAFAAGDRLVDAARATPGVVVADMTRWFCADGSCPAVIGNVLVYRDSQHLTRTYVSTLVGPLGRTVDAALRGRA